MSKETRNTVTNFLMSILLVTFIVLLFFGINLFKEIGGTYTILANHLDSLELHWEQSPDFYYSTSLKTDIPTTRATSDSLYNWLQTWQVSNDYIKLAPRTYGNLRQTKHWRDSATYQLVLNVELNDMPEKYDQPITAVMDINVYPGYVSLRFHDAENLSTVEDHSIGKLKKVNARETNYVMSEGIYSRTIGKYEVTRQLENSIQYIVEDILNYITINDD